MAATEEAMVRLAAVLALRLGVQPLVATSFQPLLDSPALLTLQAAPNFAWPQAADLGRYWASESGQIGLGVQMRRSELQSFAHKPGSRERQPVVVLRWAAVATLDDGQRRRFWQQWWHAANLLLPLTNTWLCADSGAVLGALDAAPAYRKLGDLTPEWEAAMADALPEAQGILQAAVEAAIDCPIVGYELLDEADRVVAEAELAWPDRKLAVLIDDIGLEMFEAAGWRVRMLGQGTDAGDLAGFLKQ